MRRGQRSVRRIVECPFIDQRPRACRCKGRDRLESVITVVWNAQAVRERVGLGSSAMR